MLKCIVLMEAFILEALYTSNLFAKADLTLPEMASNSAKGSAETIEIATVELYLFY